MFSIVIVVYINTQVFQTIYPFKTHVSYFQLKFFDVYFRLDHKLRLIYLFITSRFCYPTPINLESEYVTFYNLYYIILFVYAKTVSSPIIYILRTSREFCLTLFSPKLQN